MLTLSLQGLDAATCAAQNGVSLPADYNSTTSATSGSTTGNATVHPTANGTGVGSTGTGAGGSPVPFTGSASNVKVVGTGLAAGFLGVVAMLL